MDNVLFTPSIVKAIPRAAAGEILQKGMGAGCVSGFGLSWESRDDDPVSIRPQSDSECHHVRRAQVP
jgi:hypothetical protein